MQVFQAALRLKLPMDSPDPSRRVGLPSIGDYAALLPGATVIGLGVVELSGLERTIFISVQS